MARKKQGTISGFLIFGLNLLKDMFAPSRSDGPVLSDLPRPCRRKRKKGCRVVERDFK